MKDIKFPVLGRDKWPKDCPKYVRWDALSEDQAMKNHSQTLERLAERGGLSPVEIVLNVKSRDLFDRSLVGSDYAMELLKSIAIDSS